MITPEVVDIIMMHKHKMPAGWRITTREHDQAGYLVLVIPMREFEKYDVHNKIRIAEQTNNLCQRIKDTGLPCVIEKA